MFITPQEIALASLGVTALISLSTTSLVFFVGRRRDHAQRLWERQVELYDDVLREARRWHLDREPGARQVSVTQEDRESTDSTRIRFELFGDAEVGRRYREHFNAHWNWSGAHRGLATAYSHNDQVMTGALSEHERLSVEEVSRYRRTTNEAKEGADAAEKELRAAIRQAVRQVPKLKGRGDSGPALQQES